MAVTLGKPEPWVKVYHQIPCLLAQKIKTSDKKRGKPKTQGAQKQRPLKKKRQAQNTRGSKTKTLDEKRGNPKMQGTRK
jgi:hypothetical protein